MHFLARDRKFVATPDADMEDDQRWYCVLFTLSFGAPPSHSFNTTRLNLIGFQSFSIIIESRNCVFWPKTLVTSFYFRFLNDGFDSCHQDLPTHPMISLPGQTGAFSHVFGMTWLVSPA